MKMSARMLLVMGLLALTVLTRAQDYVLAKTGNNVEVTGSSSLHNWKMELTAYNSGFNLVKDGNSVKNINNINFSCRVKDLKSESNLMDRKAYDALKADKSPDIKFTGTSVTDLVTNNQKFTGKVKGNLTLAGQTKEVVMPFSGTINNNSVSIQATTSMLMSEYGITPPTAMMGTLKTGDKISVNFSLQYIQNSQIIGQANK
jgi:polyisoprenoid-binding protein YceI